MVEVCFYSNALEGHRGALNAQVYDTRGDRVVGEIRLEWVEAPSTPELEVRFFKQFPVPFSRLLDRRSRRK